MIEFRRITDFERGTLAALLADAYAYDPRNVQCWLEDWKEFDDFFYDNPRIADLCGFITVLDGEPIGLASWDPRGRPEKVEIGHNCILRKHKGNGYGGAQLREALRRIRLEPVKRIAVTTNAAFIPARRNYESAGFRQVARRANDGPASHAGDYIDYVIEE